MSLVGLSVEIGTERYPLPDMSPVLLGKDLKEIIHFVTQHRVETLYIKGIDQYIEDDKTLAGMNIGNRDIFVGSNYESSYSETEQDFLEKPTSKSKIDDPMHVIVEPEDEYIPKNRKSSFFPKSINNEEHHHHTHHHNHLYTDRETNEREKLVNLFHVISIISCIISLFVWFTELIPCALIFFLLPSVKLKLNALSLTLLLTDILVTVVVFCVFLGLIIAGVVFSFGISLILLILLIPYVVVMSACFAALGCSCCADDQTRSHSHPYH